ncbi:MAG TPA: ATP-binding protein [Gaiellaceae bacterium]|nr:ATP-binding protein [Gaiellaceae bacterium]
MRFLRTVGARLSLALLLVVAMALGIVYLAVVPSLKSRLVNARVSQLQAAAVGLRGGAADAYPLFQDFAESASHSTGARVMVFQTNSIPGGTTVGSPIADSSQGQSSDDVTNDEIATRAAESGRVQRGTVAGGDEQYAEAAVPILSGQYVLMFQDSLQSQFGSVHLVQHRVLLSAAAALLIALLVGYGGAWAFARRIRRLERAAERIAGGRFDEPVRDTGADELGELAAAFDRMRIRLAQLDDARREFVANASHELRTPLFSLAGFLELLDDEVVDEPTRREFLESMREQVARLTKLASDLLDLSRLDAGRLTVAREAVDLGALADDLVEEFGPVARRTEHELELVEDGAASVSADELRVLQIGRVLLENALLHTPEGTAVRVRATRRGASGVLEVEDDGPGIPPEHREQLFERFYRLDGTRASGSGLGLAIAKELAELMGGRIELESGPGRTTFALLLPRYAAPEQPFSRKKPVGAGA